MIALSFLESKALLNTKKGAALLAPALYMPTKEKIQARATAYAENPLCRVFYALDGTEPVGLCIVQTDDRQAEILALAVQEAYRKQGVGKGLIAYTQRQVRVPLTAETDDDAVGFYRRCGFCITSLGEKYPGVTRYHCSLKQEDSSVMHITVVGGMNLDILGMPGGTLLPQDSNPGKVQMRPGGVGRNIAARLSALGADVSLITALGNDDQAKMLAAFCRDEKIDLTHALRTTLPSPCYLCIHDETGDMAMAISDMQAVDQLTPQAMESRMDFINAGSGCVLDANLPAETLQYIAAHATVPLFLDPVSCHKAPKVLPILSSLTAIKPNMMEAETLTGKSNPQEAAQALRKQGTRHVFISMGAKGVYYAGPREAGLCPAIPLPALPLTGAGDALMAGLTHALLQGMDTQMAARAGSQAAHQALLAAL